MRLLFSLELLEAQVWEVPKQGGAQAGFPLERSANQVRKSGLLQHQVLWPLQAHLDGVLPPEVQMDVHQGQEYQALLLVEESLGLDAARILIWGWQQAVDPRAWAVLPYRCPALPNYRLFRLHLRPT